MSEPAAAPPPAPARRCGPRRAAAGLLAALAALALAACGTANGALRPEPSTSAPASPAPAPSAPAPRPTPSPASTPPPTAAPPTATAPGSGAPAPVVHSTASGGRTVALTFDDGPGPATGQVLDLLAQYGARATFCLIGRQAVADPATVKRILAAGHRLCDHTVDHPQPFAAFPHDRAVQEIADGRRMIVQAGGPDTEVGWFRAPGGAFTPDNRAIAADHGLRPLGWSVDPRDWSRPGTAAIVSAVQDRLRPGGVVLLHDGGGDRTQTVAALRQLLPWLTAQGYRFDFPAN
ncbi:polysaccharide deacetylase family protein [Kitasatospora sp. NPDC058115]|uniref:polysaccharide deacetylase family protein n=1 Tax=Kitasatospora sp. NPDC058115 TaxID=3346347 RepID=UPI0036D9A0B1